MAKRVLSIAELAKRSGMDPEAVLLSVWEAGLDHYRDPRDRVRRRDIDIALRAVGLPTGRDLTDPIYWMDRFGLEEEPFRELLRDLGTPMNRAARTLPKGAVAKLRRYSMRGVTGEEVAVVPEAPQVPVGEAFEWKTVGNRRDVRVLSEAEVEGIHWELVRDFAADKDPIDPPGVRSADLLASAVFRQHTSLGEETKYPTVEMSAAALFHAIVHDHPFYNGNKRTALVSMLVLLDENGVMPTCEEEELFELVLRLAQHRLVPRGNDLADREMLHVAEWLLARSRNVEKGDRPIQWRKLRQILRGYECDLWHPKAGNRINVSRQVEEPGMFRRRKRTLTVQVKYTDEGREATVSAVKMLRRGLWLDEEHGIDSLDFYQRGGVSPSDFIVKYRKTLKRLARL